MKQSFSKSIVAVLGLLVLIVSLIASRTHLSAPSRTVPAATPAPVDTPTASAVPSLSTPDSSATYGITVTLPDACSDGIHTTLHLQTVLDTNFWRLTRNDFGPSGTTYFETAIVLLENGALFSTNSSGARAEPVFDAQDRSVSVAQTFIFPATPSPNSKFMLKAQVTLSGLPSPYAPPIAMPFLEPGIIEIPTVFEMPVSIGACK